MNDHNQKVEPVRFEPAGTPAVDTGIVQPEKPARRDSAPGWVIPALATLVVVALIVFFWLPRQIDPADIDIGEQAPSQMRNRPAATEVSPWSDAQLARQRKDAQEILAQLLEEQFALEELAVAQWAPDEFAAAQDLATSGDEQYRTQAFLEAAGTYQQALDAMIAISARADEVFQEQMRLGGEALRSDQAEAAIAAFELAIVLQPENEEAARGLDRARNLEPLLALLRQANEAREADDLEAARTLLQQANRLDPEHGGAEAQLRGIERDIARRDFNRAMTAGYAALDEARYDEAERQFVRAQGILPSAAETESALLQARTARTRAQIDAFGQRAQAAESREDWNQAKLAYGEILTIDDSVVFARAGLIRSQTRAKLDKNLREVLAKPERLGDDRIYRNTRKLYEQALALEQKGPLLRRQLEQLDELLRLAIVPVAILLHSDEQTDVTVYKVAHLGTFRRQQLSLKPGTYTAVGVRTGYRDVRKKFTVGHDRENKIVEISCTEPI